MAFTVRLTKAGGNIDSKGVTHYTRTYAVESDDLDDAPGDVITAGELASLVYLSSHPDDPNALLKSKNATQTTDLMMWECVFDWDTEQSNPDRGTQGGASSGSAAAGVPGTNPTEAGKNTSATPPENRPPKYEWGNVSTERLLTRNKTQDGAGNIDPAPPPVINSARQLYDPPPSVSCSDLSLTITLYRLVAQPAKIILYTDSVNRAAFLGFPLKTVRCTSYKQTSQYEAQHGWFWEYQITLQIRTSEAWTPLKILDAGTTQKKIVLGVPKLVPCTDSHGNAVTTPVPLNGAGVQLALDGAFVYLEFDCYYHQDFDKLIDG